MGKFKYYTEISPILELTRWTFILKETKNNVTFLTFSLPEVNSSNWKRMFFFSEEVDYETNYYKMPIVTNMFDRKWFFDRCNATFILSVYFHLISWYMKAKPRPEELNVPPVTNIDNYPILREEIEATAKSLKKGKSLGLDNIPGGDGLGKRKCRDQCLT